MLALLAKQLRIVDELQSIKTLSGSTWMLVSCQKLPEIKVLQEKSPNQIFFALNAK